jgi:hypothetical protein
MYYTIIYGENIEFWSKHRNADRALEMGEANLLYTYGSKNKEYQKRIKALLLLKKEDILKLGISVEKFPI